MRKPSKSSKSSKPSATTLSAEEYRQIIIRKVQDALRRGYRPYDIGMKLASDYGFVRKLFDESHTFKQSTMLLVHTKLDLISDDPAIPKRSQRFLF